MIKEKYKQWRLSYQIGRIRTIGYTQTLQGIRHITRTRLISLANDNVGSEKLEKKSKFERVIND
ncbi:MAG: hypothetical protein HQ554_04505 [FCB group bacterium]|nr:hypothetical protein [FCB group bacterium]